MYGGSTEVDLPGFFRGSSLLKSISPYCFDLVYGSWANAYAEWEVALPLDVVQLECLQSMLPKIPMSHIDFLNKDDSKTHIHLFSPLFQQIHIVPDFEPISMEYSEDQSH